ncbi:MAG: hypothetical protein CMP23_14965 [Rickettsiales bacterium]|nr:hypothetical protein [Rickettsiales bacterium]
MNPSWMIYGAYGYTGTLCIEEALAGDERPVLAGRDPERLEAVAAEFGLESRCFSLQDSSALDAGLRGIAAVLHCAGPFSATSAPMVEACARGGVHYLDVTGEIAVFEALFAHGERWRQAGIVVMPGVGFDVVPTDCLAAELKRLVPEAVALKLGFQVRGGRVSPGTARSTVEAMGRGTAVRRAGRIEVLPQASLRRQVDFGAGPVSAVAISWGDVSTAWHSTGIDDIEVYMGLPDKLIERMAWGERLGPVLRLQLVQRFLKARIDARVKGPSAQARERSSTALWGEARDAGGLGVALRMVCPDGYSLTAEAAVDLTLRVVAGELGPGAWTPSKAFGPDLALAYRGVRREPPQPL